MTLVKNAKNYLVESYAELKKVTWPNKKQTKEYTIIVVALSLGMAAFFALLDYGFSGLLGMLLSI